MANESVFTTVEKGVIIAAFSKFLEISNSLERIAGALERAYPPPPPPPKPEKKGWFKS